MANRQGFKELVGAQAQASASGALPKMIHVGGQDVMKEVLRVMASNEGL